MLKSKNLPHIKGRRILVGITGSISAYKICSLISQLVQNGAEVKIIATPSALKFVGKATLEGLSHHPIFTSDFSDGGMMAHIQLAQWAELFLIAPVTAQSLNALACGVGHSLLLSTFLAYDTKKPLWLAPAMNPQMLAHPSTQNSLRELQQWGLKILSGFPGRLACGDEGNGRLIEPDDLLQIIHDYFSPQKIKGRVLITAGGTRVPIDSVRSMTNTSTGRTGSRLAEYFQTAGYQVDLITSQTAITPSNVTVYRYDTFEDLDKQLQHLLQATKYSAILHAAAVSDFRVESVVQDGEILESSQKIESAKKVQINMIPNKKIIHEIKNRISKETTLIGFKLTDLNQTESPEQNIRSSVDKVFASGADFVVQNDVSEISQQQHHFHLFDRNSRVGFCEGVETLAPLLLQKIIESQKIIFHPAKEV